MIERDRIQGALLGLAIGDALGAPYEFLERDPNRRIESFANGGPFHLNAGNWTDDTSMAMCLAESLVAKHGFDAKDQMKRYLRWYRDGYWSSTGHCFDIGNQTRLALELFEKHPDNPFQGDTSYTRSGNGCIMRLAPIAIAYRHDADRAARWARSSARTTHGSIACLDASELFARMLVAALRGNVKSAILHVGRNRPFVDREVRLLTELAYAQKPAEKIHGSGFVIESLEAALWCFHTTDSFAEAVKRAVWLGADADTTAAVTGQLAGAFYGVEAIPAQWRTQVTMGSEILSMADRLMDTKMDDAESHQRRPVMPVP